MYCAARIIFRTLPSCSWPPIPTLSLLCGGSVAATVAKGNTVQRRVVRR